MNEPRPRSMPHRWSFAQQREQQIQTLQAELDAIRKAMRAYPDSDLVSLAQSLSTANGHYELCLAWAQAAYTRLQALMTIGVSLTPDAVTKQLLEDAPEAVKTATTVKFEASV